MRIAKLSKDDKLVAKHGIYAEVMGLIESPTGMKARLKFGDGHRETIPVQRIRIVQNENIPRSRDGWF